MRRTLIIGLGGTGMKIGHVIKRRVSEFFTREELESDGNQLVQFLFIENDLNEMDRAVPFAGAAGVKVSDFEIMPGPNANAYRDRARKLMGQKKSLSKDDADLVSWFDPDVSFPSGTSAVGMAANRQLGKLALYQRYNEVTGAIQGKIDSLKRAAPGQPMDGNSVAIYIISSICGGTGSSTYMDVAGIVDLATDRGIDKRAVLLLPSEFLRALQGKSASDETYFRYLANSWAFMQECEYFKKYEKTDNSLMHKFMSRPSNLATKAKSQTSFQPFTVAYLFENQTSDEHSIQGDNLYRFIGDSVFEMICGSANDSVASVLINRDPTSEHYDHHRTVAYLTLEFPKAEYEEYFLSRFLYECASQHIYKAELSGPDVKGLEGASVSFCKKLRDEVLPDAIAAVTGDIEQSAERIGLLRTAADRSQYADAKSQKIKDKAELGQLFEAHGRMVSVFATRAKLIADQQARRYCNFQQLFSNDNEPVDRLRSSLWAAVAETVRKSGYRSLVGDSAAGEPGFLERVSTGVLAWLKQMGDELSTVQGSLERLRGNLGKAQTSLTSNSSGMLGRKTLKDVAKETDEVGSLISQICDFTGRKVVLELKIAIVSSFAEATHQNPRPWLSHYAAQMRNAIEGIAQPMSISRWVDDKKPDGDSLAARYLQELKLKFQNAEKDVFRWCIPYALHKMASIEGWKPDAENPLGMLYSGNVKVSAALVAEIFQEETPLGELTLQLSRIGEDPEKMKENLGQIENRVTEFFRRKYLAAEYPLGKFLGMSLVEAWGRLADRPREKEIQKAFLTATRNPPFALPMTLGGDQANDRMKFASVFGDPSFVEFAHVTLGVPQAQIVQHQKESLRTRLSYLQIISRIKFSDILTMEQCKTAYEAREVDIVRPHTYRDWNNYVDGPWNDQFKLKESYAGVKIGSMGYDVSLEEAFLLCLIMDGLGRLDKEVRSTVFVSDPKALLRNHLLPSAPIMIDRKNDPPKCWYATAFEVSDEVGASSGKKKTTRTLKYAIPESKRSEFRFDPRRLNFGEALQDLRAGGVDFNEAVSSFIRVVMSHRDLIKKKLGDKKGAAAAASNLTEIAESLHAIRRMASTIDPADAQFAEEIFGRAGAMTKRLFGEGI